MWCSDIVNSDSHATILFTLEHQVLRRKRGSPTAVPPTVTAIVAPLSLTQSSKYNDSRVSTGMSFCRGSVNCHGSDGQMYNFCESSRSGEIFLDQYRGGGVFIPRDKFIRIGLFRSVVCSERVVTNASHCHSNFNTSGCDSKLNIF